MTRELLTNGLETYLECADKKRLVSPAPECEPIVLPWPPSSLSGHAKGHWKAKSAETKKLRAWAFAAALNIPRALVPESGDIHIKISFVPPNRRGDRTNFPNRIKAYLDGIADALRVNDSRFLPSYEFCEPSKPGAIHITLRGIA